MTTGGFKVFTLKVTNECEHNYCGALGIYIKLCCFVSVFAFCYNKKTLEDFKDENVCGWWKMGTHDILKLNSCIW